MPCAHGTHSALVPTMLRAVFPQCAWPEGGSHNALGRFPTMHTSSRLCLLSLVYFFPPGPPFSPVSLAKSSLLFQVHQDVTFPDTCSRIPIRIKT